MAQPSPAPWWRNDAVITATLIVIAALGFVVTHFINKSYQRREDALARRWYQRGEADLSSGRPNDAAAAFRTAIIYSRDNPQYRLRLAEALAADNDIPQAIAYFTTLWEQQPGSGPLNLELARLYARSRQPRLATQHYNAAIYGVWPSDPILERRKARVEYIDFLQEQQQPAQARAEAVALAASVPTGDTAGHLQAADLLLSTGDPDHALAEYLAVQKVAPAEAFLGAGKAAFQLGQMQSAARYLQLAQQRGSNDVEGKTLLQNAQLVINADPSQHRIGPSKRADRVSAAYQRAGQRLQQCAAQKNQQLETTDPFATELQKLYAEWSSAGPDVKKAGHDSDVRDSLMDLVLRIEQTTAHDCGNPSVGTADWALLALDREREAGQQ
jgi:Flp pilus assembly protein TadD